MNLVSLCRGAIICTLFIFFNFSTKSVSAEPVQITVKAVTDFRWSALLHFYHGETIDQPDFYLTETENFSPKAELHATIKFLDSNILNHCRYPARAQFLAEYGLVNEVELTHCQDYQEFQTKAPSDSIYLTYTSENLSQPSSAMGHIMLMLQKETNDGNLIEHGVSFFTELDSYNPISIIYNTVIRGKTGFFQVSPYHEKAGYYRFIEGRNVWEYKLNLSEKTQQLLRKHIWELKHTPPIYYFHKYNCATLTLNLLNLIEPKLSEASRLNVSPLDVVKSAHSTNVTQAPVVQLSPSWEIKMILESLSDRERDLVIDVLKNNAILPEDEISNVGTFLIKKLIATGKVFHKTHKTNLDWQYLEENVKKLSNFTLVDNYKLDISDYKNPIDKTYDSSLTLTGSVSDKASSLSLEYVPASHLLTDSSFHLFGINSLKIMSPTISVDENQNIELDELALYQFKSLVPYDRVTQSLSGSIDISVRNNKLDQTQHVNLVGDVGFSYSPDISNLTYALIGLNTFLGNESMLASQVNFGYAFEPNSRFKIIADYTYLEGLTKDYNQSTFEFISSASLSLKNRLLLGVEYIKSKNHQDNLVVSVGIRQGFL